MYLVVVFNYFGVPGIVFTNNKAHIIFKMSFIQQIFNEDQ